MDQIKHSHVQINGLKLHVAEIGAGPQVVLFLHGFPEIWYTWRHQMIAVANNGYRAIAIDFRGYGLSDQPPEPEKGTFMDLLDDIVALLDTLAFPVGSGLILSQGAPEFFPAYLMGVLHPNRVAALVTLGIPFMQPGPSGIQTHHMPKGFYIARWQFSVMEPGRAEADFARLDVKTVIKNIYILFSGTEPPAAKDDNEEIMDLVDPSPTPPPWFSEEDLEVYASLYEKSGFRFALQVPYRNLNVESGIKDPKITIPTLFIIGEKDFFLKFAGVDDYIRGGKVKQFVPELSVIFMEEGNHFVHEQLPLGVNVLLLNFLNQHSN